MNRQITFSWFMSLAVITILLWSSALHAQAACQPVFDALNKVITTPSHSYSTQTTKGKSTITETIYTHGKGFNRADGKWMSGPEPKEVLEHETENRKRGTVSCQVVREEFVNGQPATVYSVLRKTQHVTYDGQMWISKGTGLPLRQEMDMDVDIGNMGKSHVSTRYEYGNVQPPM